MKAIKTKYKGPTNYRGSRIIASDEDGNKVTISYPYELSGEAVHRKAAEALCDKMQWTGKHGLIAGSLKNGYVFVFSSVPALRNALEIAEITIALLDRNKSAQGTLDVIKEALA
jgi:hypothetical protein